eukprot:TRINITY_DN485_c0_g1_i17.p1 TRINITY_DN485_c0_g1~~TRINITY_DN485_c0_g1_i17.p1  ORF type:complete len:109 (+),score=7.66 TRINITY_DN485_c0_g1_i17:62-388(+)
MATHLENSNFTLKLDSPEIIREYISKIQNKQTIFPNELKFIEEESNSFYQFQTFTSALEQDNLSKNRYMNVLPAEESRVILDFDKDFFKKKNSDYINANYLSVRFVEK